MVDILVTEAFRAQGANERRRGIVTPPSAETASRSRGIVTLAKYDRFRGRFGSMGTGVSR